MEGWRSAFPSVEDSQVNPCSVDQTSAQSIIAARATPIGGIVPINFIGSADGAEMPQAALGDLFDGCGDDCVVRCDCGVRG